MPDTVDFGYNLDDKENRERFALNYRKTQCPAGRVVKESAIERGTDSLGRPARTYTLYVKF
ncbi:hypothetical protein AMC79_CH01154 [Rhizobium phaseoli]|nr:hypothetical protein AMC89_CH01157 [Rhizobium phaseoli]ANL96983.1 hypothetical protein AMC79_CH01154 [Rhizobium phaseoli]